MKTITKAEYLKLLAGQYSHLEQKVYAIQDNLRSIENAIEDAESKDFSSVEVIEEGNQFTFKIVEKNND